MRRALAAASLLLAATVLAPHAAAQDRPPAKVAQRTTAATPQALKARATYEPSDFEMTVNPPIKLKGGVLVESLKFRSAFESVDPDRNDLVRARLFHTAKPGKAAVVALGGWKFDPLTPELARALAETGIQVLWIEIPFQGQRTPKGRRPGDLTLSADLLQNEDTFVQLALDVQRALDWLLRERKVDPGRIGLIGTSLGGFAAATLYGMLPRFKACVAQLAGSDVAAVLFNGNWLTRRIAAELRAKGLGEDDVRHKLRGMDPITWASAKRKDGLLIVAAELDEIVPIETSRKLAREYGGARMIVMEGAPHRAAQGLQDSFPEVRAHLEKLLRDAK